MKITDPKLLHELYEVEAERKLLIGYRFKGCSATPHKRNGAHQPSKRRPLVMRKTRKRGTNTR